MEEFPTDFDAVNMLKQVNKYQKEYDDKEESKLTEIRPQIIRLAHEATKTRSKHFVVNNEILIKLDPTRIRKLGYELASRFPKVEFHNMHGEMETIRLNISQKEVTNINNINSRCYFIVYFEC